MALQLESPPKTLGPIFRQEAANLIQEVSAPELISLEDPSEYLQEAEEQLDSDASSICVHSVSEPKDSCFLEQLPLPVLT